MVNKIVYNKENTIKYGFHLVNLYLIQVGL